MQALTPLAQLKMVQNNHALDELLHDLDKAIQGMQGKVSEAVKRFQRLLETKQYCEAAKLLEKAGCPIKSMNGGLRPCRILVFEHVRLNINYELCSFSLKIYVYIHITYIVTHMEPYTLRACFECLHLLFFSHL